MSLKEEKIICARQIATAANGIAGLGKFSDERFDRAPMRLRSSGIIAGEKGPRSLRARGAAHARRKLGVFAFGSAVPKRARLCSAAVDAA